MLLVFNGASTLGEFVAPRYFTRPNPFWGVVATVGALYATDHVTRRGVGNPLCLHYFTNGDM